MADRSTDQVGRAARVRAVGLGATNARPDLAEFTPTRKAAPQAMPEPTLLDLLDPTSDLFFDRVTLTVDIDDDQAVCVEAHALWCVLLSPGAGTGQTYYPFADIDRLRAMPWFERIHQAARRESERYHRWPLVRAMLRPLLDAMDQVDGHR